MGQASENLRNDAHGDAPEIHGSPQRERLKHRRQKPPVDAAMGVGSEMSLEEMANGLARLITKGVRTATIYRMGDVPVVMTRDLPEGVFAMRSNNRIVAYRDGRPILTLPVIVAPAA